jgi:hypothetical protein
MFAGIVAKARIASELHSSALGAALLGSFLVMNVLDLIITERDGYVNHFSDETVGHTILIGCGATKKVASMSCGTKRESVYVYVCVTFSITVSYACVQPSMYTRMHLCCECASARIY